MICLIFWLCLLAIAYSSTLVAVKCADGLIVASDSMQPVTVSSKRSLGMVRTRMSQNVRLINEDIIIGVASGPNHLHPFLRQLEKTSKKMEFVTGRPLDIDEIAHYARKLINEEYPELHLLFAGYSEQKKQYKLFEIAPKGTLLTPSRYFVAGSGGDLIRSILESSLSHKEWSPSITEDVFAAIGDVTALLPTVASSLPLVRQALSSASKVDLLSGGFRPSMWVLSNDD